MNHQTLVLNDIFLSDLQSDFENCKIDKVDASHLVLKYRTFTDCQFIDCNFTQTEFLNCTFFNCSFIDCNLSLASLSGSLFNKVEFIQSKLIGIDWARAKWTTTSTNKKNRKSTTTPLLSFTKCILDYAIFRGLSLNYTLFKASKLLESNFEEASLQYTDFEDSDLNGSIFKNTNLTKADFSKAINYQINPQYNLLKQAKFSMPEVLNLIYVLDIEILQE